MPKNTRITVATTTATSPIMAPKRGPSPSIPRNPRAFGFTRTFYGGGEGGGPEGGVVTYASYRRKSEGTPLRTAPSMPVVRQEHGRRVEAIAQHPNQLLQRRNHHIRRRHLRRRVRTGHGDRR